MAGNYLLKGLTFFSIPIFTRLMTTSDYGIYNSFVAYESIIFVFIGLALHSSFKNAKYKFEENFDSYVASCVSLGLLCFLCFIMLANVFYRTYSGTILFSRVVINMLLCNSMGNALILYFTTYVGLSYNYKSFLAISGTNAVLNIALSIFFITKVFPEYTYMGRIVGTTIPIVGISIFTVCFFYRKAKPNLNKVYVKYAMKISAPIMPHGLSQVILSQFDRIMILSIIGASEAGLYSFAYNIYMIVQVTVSSLDNVWGPWFFERMKERAFGSIKKNSNRYVVGMTAFISCLMLGSPELIRIFASEAYWKSIYVVIPIVIGGFFSFLYTLPVLVEYYYEKTKFIALATMGAALMNIVLNAIFIPCYGYIAAAYTTLVTYAAYFLFHYSISRRLDSNSLFSIGTFLISSLVVFVIGGISLLFIDCFVIRWLLIAGITIALSIWLERSFGVVALINRKLAKRK